MAIITCNLCGPDGTALVPILVEWWEPPKIERMQCPSCGGARKWRDPSDDFTPLDELPCAALMDMARVRPWCRLDDEGGRLWFIAGPGIPKDNNSLMELLQITSRLGKALTEHNWLVRY